MDPVADPSPSRRSLKRRPPARSPELSPKAGPGPGPGAGEAAEEELIRRVEELEAAAARLRGEKEAAEEAARGLRLELDAERASAETAASEAMLMIERLQRDKAAAQMEARQFKRYAEGREDREREVQEDLASLSDLAASYHSRLQSHGIDPDSFTDEEEDEESYEEVGAEDVEQVDMTGHEVERNARDSSSGMEVKAMVVGNDRDGEEEDEEEEEPSSPVEKEFEYTVDVTCASTTKPATSVVAEYVGDGNSGGLYARVEALEADRVALRREIAALQAESAQLVMAREMARRLCWEMVAEQRAIVKKAVVPASSFSVLRICKWVLSILFWRNRSSTVKYTFGLSTTFLGLLLLLDRSVLLSPWLRLPRPQR
ncbi:myosin-binding protein 7-like [Miscanthus floridulus]|uniref:myosin-binding protein 7-like n=1 Tax=Miscanthus floridulus TaxID=154761 RepID=UPI0034599C2E